MGQVVSINDCRSYISSTSDEINNDGVDSSDDQAIALLEEALIKCQRRTTFCNGYYPFRATNSTIEINAQYATWQRDVYMFLLLATRINMQTYRILDGLDGTQLFERICNLVVKEYLGQHAKSYVFGTAVKGSFKDKVSQLAKDLHINGIFKSPLGSTHHQKDGNLDIIAWVPFADQKDGQLIAMGQCKTGDHWEDKLGEISPETFFGSYLTTSPYVTPVRMFFVAESFGEDKWEERSRSGGILFDRTRIMEFLPGQIEQQLYDDIRKWNDAALESLKKSK